MIERKFVANNIKEFQIKEFVIANLGRVGLSSVKLQRTPLGEKIIIAASRPGLVVGRAGANIASMTKKLKKEFKLENPQIEIEEVKESGLDASIIAELIAGSLERFGSARFKGIGHKAMTNVLNAGGVGVEILISGKIPSSRAKTWRFYMGYLKKCGEISVSGVLKAYSIAKLKTGVVGIKVSIMPPDLVLPDKIQLTSELQELVEEVQPEEAAKVTEEIESKVEEKTTETTDSETKESKSEESVKEQTDDKKEVKAKSKKVATKKIAKKKVLAKKTTAKKVTKKKEK